MDFDAGSHWAADGVFYGRVRSATTVRMAESRILIVEDEFLLACSLEEDLRGFGYDVVGPFSSLAAALDAARREAVDAAILDVNLNGTMVYPLADELVARGTPVMFLSGYGMAVIPDRFQAVPRLPKPSDPAVVDRELRRLLAIDG
jgi:CheY-like chemotaxis protein